MFENLTSLEVILGAIGILLSYLALRLPVAGAEIFAALAKFVEHWRAAVKPDSPGGKSLTKTEKILLAKDILVVGVKVANVLTLPAWLRKLFKLLSRLVMSIF